MIVSDQGMMSSGCQCCCSEKMREIKVLLKTKGYMVHENICDVGNDIRRVYSDQLQIG